MKSPGAKPPFYYSFDVANIHFIAICTEAPKTAGGKNVADQKMYDLPFSYNEQMRWLEDDLAKSKAAWKVPYFHRPMHTVGGYPCPDDFRKEAGAIFDKHKVQLILSGHDHSYQKTFRINNVTRKLADAGSVQIVSGGGDTSIFDRKTKPDWNIVHQRINHYMQIEATPDEMRFRAVNAKGEVFDEWTLPQVGQPVAMK